LRIAVVNNFFPPRVGGSAHLSNALAVGYAAAGHEVVVLTATYYAAPTYEERDGLKIFRLQAYTLPPTRLAISFDLSFASRPSNWSRMRRILDAFKPNVIHQHGQFLDLTWMTGWYARARGIPVLLSIHTRLESPTPNYSRLFRALDTLLVAPQLRRSRPTFVVMDVQMGDYIRQRYRRAIKGMVPIPVGINETVVPGNAQLVRDRHELHPEAPVILSLGHVIQMRDRLRLVDALPALRLVVPDAKVLVVGRVYVDTFLTRARQLGVADMIISAGAVPHHEVASYFAAANVETHDLDGYGLGVASLEAMAAGVPVVAAVRRDNFPGVELRSGETCWLVDIGKSDQLASALATALSDRAAATAVGLAGQRLVRKHFTIDAVTRAHLDVFAGMKSERAGSGQCAASFSVTHGSGRRDAGRGGNV
jgi:glycosyltransferase involved in cell wall biosynthesis